MVIPDESKRLVCCISKVLELARGKCRVPDCSSVYTTVSHETCGCVLAVHCICKKGHKFHWTSSSQINNDNGVKLYEDNLLFAMGVVLSGNNYSKLEQYCKILEIQTISRTTFHMHQQLYICP